MDTLSLRNAILQNLKNQTAFENIVTANINGNYFSAADVALAEKKGEPEVYRIVVIRHNPQKFFI